MSRTPPGTPTPRTTRRYDNNRNSLERHPTHRLLTLLEPLRAADSAVQAVSWSEAFRTLSASFVIKDAACRRDADVRGGYWGEP